MISTLPLSTICIQIFCRTYISQMPLAWQFLWFNFCKAHVSVKISRLTPFVHKAPTPVRFQRHCTICLVSGTLDDRYQEYIRDKSMQPRIPTVNGIFLKWHSNTSHVGMVMVLKVLRNAWILLLGSGIQGTRTRNDHGDMAQQQEESCSNFPDDNTPDHYHLLAMQGFRK